MPSGPASATAGSFSVSVVSPSHPPLTCVLCGPLPVCDVACALSLSQVLGEGELSKPLTIKAAKFSSSAAEKIAAAGATAEQVPQRAKWTRRAHERVSAWDSLGPAGWQSGHGRLQCQVVVCPFSAHICRRTLAHAAAGSLSKAMASSGSSQHKTKSRHNA